MPATPFYVTLSASSTYPKKNSATYHHVEPRHPTSLRDTGYLSSIELDSAYLFILLVEHRDDEDQDRSNAALEHAEEKSEREERPEGVGDGVQHHDDSPCDDVCAEVLAQPKALGDKHGGEYPDQEAWGNKFEPFASWLMQELTDVEGQCDQVVPLCENAVTVSFIAITLQCEYYLASDWKAHDAGRENMSGTIPWPRTLNFEPRITQRRLVPAQTCKHLDAEVETRESGRADIACNTPLRTTGESPSPFARESA